MSGQLERWLVRRLLDSVGSPPVAIELSTGEQVDVLPPGCKPIAVVRLQDRRALLALMQKPEKSFGELFTDEPPEGGLCQTHGLTGLGEFLIREQPWSRGPEEQAAQDQGAEAAEEGAAAWQGVRPLVPGAHREDRDAVRLALGREPSAPRTG